MSREWVITVVIWFLCIGVLCYFIGYLTGFKKSREIDDKIISELSEKYNK